ncbi:arsinothricin resistance N-acetyltransferase ArsN1 [Paenibacillus sp. JX-17]|uniref:Arsinothricin resistance N-acetyltransferase ArsN1 n=1 Tax=Paenibacillus lacisoli TaxID=3064525 RepID=A0ABT9CHH5_9BACL|nr:arsinothricin resistance N-acetyltransferase ArsN1 family A [Paenibacillus sp. JX-17]MDO7908720.1 arsinothricin resistance N-acetyltransferase ArsN1 [Paenibacillus sp. JX-17]
MLLIRQAQETDLPGLLEIYNQGIEDRIATLESQPKNEAYMSSWFDQHQGRYTALVAEEDGKAVGWAAINPYSNRCAYDGVGDLSVYIHREYRGRGIGTQLLQAIDRAGRENGFYKIVLYTFPSNLPGQKLYRKSGYREVGIFENQGVLDGRFVDVMAMEKLL